MTIGAGVEIYPALRINTSHGPTLLATSLRLDSSVTEHANTETLVDVFERSDSVSRRVDSVRPIRTTCLADAFA